MEIFVAKGLTADTISLCVSGSDTVLTVKEKIVNSSFAIPRHWQRLVYVCEVLEDSTALHHYGIQNGSTLQVLSIEPIIHIYAFIEQRLFNIRVPASVSIDFVKATLNDYDDRMRVGALCFHNEPMVDDRTLASYGIGEGCMLLQQGQLWGLWVLMIDSDEGEPVAERDYTMYHRNQIKQAYFDWDFVSLWDVGAVLELVAIQWYGFDPCNMDEPEPCYLMFNSERLEQDVKLTAYAIREGSVLLFKWQSDEMRAAALGRGAHRLR